MKTYVHHNEFKILISQVLNALGEGLVKRIDEVTGDTQDHIQVNVKYAPKSRILHDLVNKNLHIQLPVIAVWNSGFSIDNKRVYNKIDGFYTALSGNDEMTGHFPQPLPINLNLSVSILSRYQSDTDQIMTCLLSNFYPYIVISYKHPDTEEEVRCKVIWNGQCNTKTPIDISPQTPYRIESDFQLVVEGWIYRNAYNPSGLILNIDSRFTSVSTIVDNYDYMVQFEDIPLSTDTVYISGRPEFRSTTPYSIPYGLSDYKIDIYGSMFNHLSGLAVSATQGVYPASSYTLIDFFSANSLSAQFPAFSGIPIENFDVSEESFMSFTLPAPLSSGNINILGWNLAGRGSLIEDSVIDGNLYYQPPYTSGINVS